jgi:hypothetical protein
VVMTSRWCLQIFNGSEMKHSYLKISAFETVNFNKSIYNIFKLKIIFAFWKNNSFFIYSEYYMLLCPL